MMTDHTETLASVDRYLKIERINRFLASKHATLTFSNGDVIGTVTAIDAKGHAIGETESRGYRIEMSHSQLEAVYTFVIEHEEKRDG
jgi:hypothetical protein